ncbi:MAG: class I SAM-dependent methyltransferase [Chitinophagales bacterium]|nr:class I SAM-dependent methyltransferase [Chitinophagales bacterium]
MSEWSEAMSNLMERRKSGIKSSSNNKLSDYKSHLSKINIGHYVLDVGCGDMYVKNFIKGKYTGIDPFPVNDYVIKMMVEELNFNDKAFDTVICFATLDGVKNKEKAIQEMKRVCKGNIYLLTGIGIEPDKYHTFRIDEKDLINSMKPFKVGYKEYLTKNVALIEFNRDVSV